MVVISIRAFRPSDLPFTASSRRWSFVNKILFFPDVTQVSMPFFWRGSVWINVFLSIKVRLQSNFCTDDGDLGLRLKDCERNSLTCRSKETCTHSSLVPPSKEDYMSVVYSIPGNAANSGNSPRRRTVSSFDRVTSVGQTERTKGKLLNAFGR